MTDEFKKALEEDIEGVFLNIDEFGEAHVVDGKEMIVLFDGAGAGEELDEKQY